MGEVRESSGGSLCTTVQPQVPLVVLSRPDRLGAAGHQRVRTRSMATGTALCVPSPRPAARRDRTIREGRGQSYLGGPDERSLHLVPTDVPPDPGPVLGTK